MGAKKSYEPGEHYDYQLLIKHILEMPRNFSPNQEIVYRDKLRITYKTLFERINRMANCLSNLGVEKGDVVCMFDYDSHRYLECFFAVPMMGAVLHTQNWRLSPEQILYTMNHAGDKVVIIHTDFLPLLEAVWDKLETVKKVILIDEDGKKPASRIAMEGEYEEMLAKSSPSYEFPEFDENTRATIFYTTGTTGLPKGVFFSHRQLVLHTFSVSHSLAAFDTLARFRSTDVYMPLTPMFHVHAWGVPLVATMMGAKQVYPGRYEPEMLIRLILTEKVTFSHCVPTIIQMILSHPAVKKLDFSKWKVIMGGAAVTKGVVLAAMEKDMEVCSAYGMSESCPLIGTIILKPTMFGKPKDEMAGILSKTAFPAALVYVAVLDPKGKELPHDGVSTGEICVRAPWLTQAYHNDPERTKALWVDGWLHTGDVGYIDADGYIQITDRIKDVIKTGGEWISSLDLENIMSGHEAVMEAAAIGIPDPKWGERPLLIAVLKPEFKGKITGEELQQFLQKSALDGKIPKYGVPQRVEIIDALPKTSVGKVSKVELRKQFH